MTAPLVPLAPGASGIRAALGAYPDTAAPLLALAQAVLRGPSSLSPGERELLAAAVSAENRCAFCAESHGAAARELLGPQAPWVDDVLALRDPAGAPERLKGLVTLARGLARSAQGITPNQARAAREAGASDRDLHDTVLVAAAFSLFNRYVDGLGCPEPADPAAYVPMGKRLAASGYQ